MAKLFSQVGNVKKAREWFEKAIQQDPHSFDAHLAFAKWLFDTKDVVGARIQAEKAGKLRPRDVELLKLQTRMAGAEMTDKSNPP